MAQPATCRFLVTEAHVRWEHNYALSVYFSACDTCLKVGISGCNGSLFSPLVSLSGVQTRYVSGRSQGIVPAKDPSELSKPTVCN